MVKQQQEAGGLEKEAAVMEAKLAELRTAMSKERAKREGLRSGGGGGIWDSGKAAGGLRNYKPAPGKKVAGKTATKPDLSGSDKQGSRPSTASSSTGVSENAPPRGNVPPDQPGGAEFDEEGSHASFLAALNEWRGGDPSDVAENPEAVAGGAAQKPKPNNTTEIQTLAPDAVPLNRPQSAKGSYFERLVQSASRPQTPVAQPPPATKATTEPTVHPTSAAQPSAPPSVDAPAPRSASDKAPEETGTATSQLEEEDSWEFDDDEMDELFPLPASCMQTKPATVDPEMPQKRETRTTPSGEVLPSAIIEPPDSDDEM
ncbi:hypothetical protein CYMTET_17858 [Cymbomonas tetramitiformis]|uniref:Uncharacterized protein n=1 Tax=Cymbomonas tetramitiformis TaxID=36881 RepID=A0AAE0G9G5_9CHLO|nr:hypothetical protein CYMTET_17858 [Cymbomonas tetramitiformis]